MNQKKYAILRRIDIESVSTETFTDLTLARARYEQLLREKSGYPVWLVEVLAAENVLADPDGL